MKSAVFALAVCVLVTMCHADTHTQPFGILWSSPIPFLPSASGPYVMNSDKTMFVSMTMDASPTYGIHNATSGALLGKVAVPTCKNPTGDALNPFFIVSETHGAYLCDDKVQSFLLSTGALGWAAEFPKGMSASFVGGAAFSVASDGLSLLVGVSTGDKTGVKIIDATNGDFKPGTFYCPHDDAPFLISKLSFQTALVGCLGSGMYGISTTDASHVDWSALYKIKPSSSFVIQYNYDILYQLANSSVVRISQHTGDVVWLYTPPADQVVQLTLSTGDNGEFILLSSATETTAVHYSTGSFAWSYKATELAFDESIHVLPAYGLFVRRQQNTIVGVNISTGKQLWSITSKLSASNYGVADMGNGRFLYSCNGMLYIVTNAYTGSYITTSCAEALSAPCTIGGDMTYIASTDSVVAASSTDIVAISANRKTWSVTTNTDAALFKDGIIYQRQSNALTAVSLADQGARLWSTPQQEPQSDVSDEVKPIAFAGYIMSKMDDEVLEVFDALNGKYVTSIVVDHSCSPRENAPSFVLLLQDGNDYIYFASNWCLFRINKALQVTNFELPVSVDSHNSQNWHSRMTLTDDRSFLYIVSGENTLAVDTADFTKVTWVWQAAGTILQPVVADSVFAFIWGGNTLECVNAKTGSFIWSTQIGPCDSNLVLYNGTLFGSSNENIYALSTNPMGVGGDKNHIVWSIKTLGVPNAIGVSPAGILVLMFPTALKAVYTATGIHAWDGGQFPAASGDCTELRIKEDIVSVDCGGFSLSTFSVRTGLRTLSVFGTNPVDWDFTPHGMTVVDLTTVTHFPLPLVMQRMEELPPAPTVPHVEPTLPPHFVPSTPVPGAPTPFPSILTEEINPVIRNSLYLSNTATTAGYVQSAIFSTTNETYIISLLYGTDMGIGMGIEVSLKTTWRDEPLYSLKWAQYSLCHSKGVGDSAITVVGHTVVMHCVNNATGFDIASGGIKWQKELTKQVSGSVSAFSGGEALGCVAVTIGLDWYVIDGESGAVISSGTIVSMTEKYISAVKWGKSAADPFIVVSANVTIGHRPAWPFANIAIQTASVQPFNGGIIAVGVLRDGSNASIVTVDSTGVAAIGMSTTRGAPFAVDDQIGSILIDSKNNVLFVGIDGDLFKVEYSNTTPFASDSMHTAWYTPVAKAAMGYTYENFAYYSSAFPKTLFVPVERTKDNAKSAMLWALDTASGKQRWNMTLKEWRKAPSIVEYVPMQGSEAKYIVAAGDSVSFIDATSGTMIWDDPIDSKRAHSFLGAGHDSMIHEKSSGVSVGTFTFSGISTSSLMSRSYYFTSNTEPSVSASKGVGHSVVDAYVADEATKDTFFLYENGVVTRVDGSKQVWTYEMFTPSAGNLIGLVAYVGLGRVYVVSNTYADVLNATTGFLITRVDFLCIGPNNQGFLGPNEPYHMIDGNTIVFSIDSALIRIDTEKKSPQATCFNSASTWGSQAARIYMENELSQTMVWGPTGAWFYLVDTTTLMLQHAIPSPVVGVGKPLVTQQFMIIPDFQSVSCFSLVDGSLLWTTTPNAPPASSQTPLQLVAAGGSLWAVGPAIAKGTHMALWEMTLKVELAEHEERIISSTVFCHSSRESTTAVDFFAVGDANRLIVVTSDRMRAFTVYSPELQWETEQTSLSHFNAGSKYLPFGQGVAVISDTAGGLAVIDAATGEPVYFLSSMIGASPFSVSGTGVIVTGGAYVESYQLYLKPQLPKLLPAPSGAPQTIPPGYHMKTPAPTVVPMTPTTAPLPSPHTRFDYAFDYPFPQTTDGFHFNAGTATQPVVGYVALITGSIGSKLFVFKSNNPAATSKTGLPTSCTATWIGQAASDVAVVWCHSAKTFVAYHVSDMKQLWTVKTSIVPLTTTSKRGVKAIFDPNDAMTNFCVMGTNGTNQQIECRSSQTGSLVYSDTCMNDIVPPMIINNGKTVLYGCVQQSIAAVVLSTGVQSWKTDDAVQCQSCLTITGSDAAALVTATIPSADGKGTDLITLNAEKGIESGRTTLASLGDDVINSVITQLDNSGSFIALIVTSTGKVELRADATALTLKWKDTLESVNSGTLTRDGNVLLVGDNLVTCRANTDGKALWTQVVPRLIANNKVFLPITIDNKVHFFISSPLSVDFFFVNTTSDKVTWMISAQDVAPAQLAGSIPYSSTDRCMLLVEVAYVRCVDPDLNGWTFNAVRFTAVGNTLYTSSVANVAKVVNGELAWGKQTSGLDIGTSMFDPLVLEKAIIVSGTGSVVLGLNPETGASLFSTSLEPCSPFESFSQATIMSTADKTNNVVYFSSSSLSCVYRVDGATGNVSTFTMLNKGDQPALVLGKQLLTADSYGMVYGFDTETTNVMWTQQFGFVPQSGCSLQLYGGFLIYTFNVDVKYISAATGTVAFSVRLGGHLLATPYDNKLYVSSISDLYLVDLDLNIDISKRIIWRHTGGQSETGQTMAPKIGPAGQRLTANDNVLMYQFHTSGFTHHGTGPCTAGLFHKDVIIAVCGEVLILDLRGDVLAVVDSQLGATGQGSLVVEDDWLYFLNHNNVVEGTYIGSLVSGAGPAAIPTAPPPAGTLPPDFTPQPEFSGAPTLPPKETHVSLGCFEAIGKHNPALNECLNKVINTTFAGGPNPICFYASVGVEGCKRDFMSHLTPGCASGYAVLQQVLVSLNRTAFDGMCVASQSRCADGEKSASGLCFALQVPAHLSYPAGGTLAPGAALPSSAYDIPVFTAPGEVITPQPPTPVPETPLPTPTPPTPPPTPSPYINDAFYCHLRSGHLHVMDFRLRLQGLLSNVRTLPEIHIIEEIGESDSGNSFIFNFVTNGQVDAASGALTKQLEDLMANDFGLVLDKLNLRSINVRHLHTPAPASTKSSTSAPHDAPNDSHLSGGAVAAIVICVLVAVVFVGFAARRLTSRRVRRHGESEHVVVAARGNEMSSLLPAAADTTAPQPGSVN